MRRTRGLNLWGHYRKDKKDVIFKLVQCQKEAVVVNTLKEVCIQEVAE
jgi:hypothetical protein